jgi:uncharacterized phage protein (TIGR02220 family)
MADQKRWFKVWSSIALDPTFLSLPVEVVGRWTLLGAWIAAHGEHGQITASLTAIRHVLRIPENDNGVSAVKALPHVRVEEGQNDNDEFTVIMLNWSKYQEDSTVYERVKKWRNTKSVTVQEERRREEKRGEEKRVKEQLHCEASASRNGHEALDILSWLNTKTGKHFRPTPANLDAIRCRLKEGITSGQLRAIVTRKCREWGTDERMKGFLRPATLFNRTKCEQYVGELPALPGDGQHDLPADG